MVGPMRISVEDEFQQSFLYVFIISAYRAAVVLPKIVR